MAEMQNAGTAGTAPVKWRRLGNLPCRIAETLEALTTSYLSLSTSAPIPAAHDCTVMKAPRGYYGDEAKGKRCRISRLISYKRDSEMPRVELV
jgi:hypothetical protein